MPNAGLPPWLKFLDKVGSVASLWRHELNRLDVRDRDCLDGDGVPAHTLRGSYLLWSGFVRMCPVGEACQTGDQAEKAR